jgi:glycosyltransferase involved in cell wall biosynthesis
MSSIDPLITLIIATRNSGDKLPRCLRSIREQTFPFYEVVIIDASSTDDTVAAIRRNGDIVTFWVSEPDKGIYDAWNKALRHAAGEWMLFLGADDYLYSPLVLARVADLLASASPEYRLAYGKVAFLDSEDRIHEIAGEPWSLVRDKMRRFMALPHPGVFYQQSLFAGAEPFDVSFTIGGDYDFLLGEVFEHPPLFMDITVSYMGFGGVSTTAGNGLRHLMERARAHRKRGLPAMSPLFLRQLIGEAVFFLLSALLPQSTSKAIRRTYKRLLKRPA